MRNGTERKNRVPVKVNSRVAVNSPNERFVTLYDRPKFPGLDFGEELSRTKQSHKDECDINKIVARAEKAGGLGPVPVSQEFLDVSEVPDYQSALDLIIEADALFMSQPAQLRARFGNDPAEFVRFVQDPSNQEEMIKLGLATRRPPVEPAEPASGPSKKKGGAKPPPSTPPEADGADE